MNLGSIPVFWEHTDVSGGAYRCDLGNMSVCLGSIPACCGIIPMCLGSIPAFFGILPTCFGIIPMCRGSIPACFPSHQTSDDFTPSAHDKHLT
jgi:hypothetical protein